MVVLITSSHRPSRRTRSFLKDLNKVIPNSLRVNRGKKTFDDLALIALNNGLKYVLIVSEVNANPLRMTIYGVNEKESKLVRLVELRLSGVKLLREIPDSQRPLNIRRLVIDPKDLDVLSEVSGLDKFLEALRVEIKPVDSIVRVSDYMLVKPKKLDGDVELSFICLGSMKICGPIIRVRRVVTYG